MVQSVFRWFGDVERMERERLVRRMYEWMQVGEESEKMLMIGVGDAIYI